MRMIIGGENQGKTDYVMKKYNIPLSKIIDGANCSIENSYKFDCINNFHLLIKLALEKGENPLYITKQILAKNSDVIIIMNEIGNGIIPIEKSERVWREQVGKVGCFLAENAESVERIVCGIAVKIKG